MSASKEPEPAPAEESRGERAGEALRTAVERTLAATAGSAAGTRQRAGELFDEVARRGLAASQEVARRGEAAREEATSRVADALAELRSADRDEVRALGQRIDELEARLAALEGPQSDPQVEAERGSSKADDQSDSGA